MSVSIQASFTKENKEYNGLEAIADQLIKKPLERHVVVAVIEVTEISTDITNGGTQTPKVRPVMIEALNGEAAATARKLLDERYSDRTGQGAPPATLFDNQPDNGESEAGQDPTAGPWPGDADAPEAEPKGRKGRS